MVSFTLRPIYLREGTPVFVEYEGGWPSEQEGISYVCRKSNRVSPVAGAFRGGFGGSTPPPPPRNSEAELNSEIRGK
jgi:hypothetical protein